MHRHEDRISADEGQPEVSLAPALIHHAAEHFGEPIIGRGEYAEDCGYAHDQMEMSDHKIGIVELNVENRLRQEGPAQSPGNKKRYETDGKQHGRVKAYSALPHCAEP